MEYRRMEHPHGTFCFAELHTPDVEAAARFYGSLFGWEAVRVPGTDGYRMLRLEGRDVAALRRTTGAQQLLGYVHVESADRTAEAAQELGARVVTAPFDTPGVARTCVIEDPEGAVFGLWEARGHGGAHVQDRTGSMWWIELMARDIETARGFYTSLFGWRFDETGKYGIDLTVFRIADVSVASALQYHPDWGVTPHWYVFFAVDDWEKAIRQATPTGGELEFWRDVPGAGRLGRICDPSGALFAVMRPGQVAT